MLDFVLLVFVGLGMSVVLLHWAWGLALVGSHYWGCSMVS